MIKVKLMKNPRWERNWQSVWFVWEEDQLPAHLQRSERFPKGVRQECYVRRHQCPQWTSRVEGWTARSQGLLSCFDVFTTWCLTPQIHATLLCFQGSEFVILSNKQRVRLIKVGFMFHLLLSLRLCSIPALTSRPPGKDLALMDMIIFRITWLKANL